jgi:hypothetical protein
MELMGDPWRILDATTVATEPPITTVATPECLPAITDSGPSKWVREMR